ncbi:hypothetical protein F4824DRAFT_113897 [Ustulina deusta]|nr:hypothetical protein F4824DRAFT_113897 [Ustulina deusta]
MAIQTDHLLYIFNHLFLPTKLPQEDDYDAQQDITLLLTAIDGLSAWKECTNPARREQADAAISTLKNMQRAYSAGDGSLNEVEVLSLLTELTEDTAIPLLVRQQNAGVVISRSNNRIVFEIFEISPQNNATMTTKGRLRRHFPGAAVVLSKSEFQQRKLQEAIAQTLAHMSKHDVRAMQPKAKKAGDELHEERDTNHPGMVSELLNGVLRSIGKPLKCLTIVKNMRDDVLLKDARLPWRRSPSWLLVRVALQLGFNRRTTPAEADAIYKEAMIFILCYVLELATKRSPPSEVLFSMNAKLARRLLKIGSALNARVLSYVEETTKDACAVISERWSTIQGKDVRQIDLPKLSELDFQKDTHVSLPELDEYISWMGSRMREQSSGKFQLSSTLIIFPPHDLPQLPQAFPDEGKSNAVANLEAFETWVAHHCRQWSQNNRNISCNELGSLMVTYHDLALPYYANNPEALSIMLLTIFELWIACDEAAVSLHPLLSEYNPGIPSDVLQNLLLPFMSQMQKLYHIEQYLANRLYSTRFPSTELYYNLKSPECFPAKFFDLDKELQEKHSDITRSAERKREAKLIDLRNLEMKYRELNDRAEEMECEYKDILVDRVNNFYEQSHKSDCKKCGYVNQAAGLRIDIHEWPLPQSLTKAKAVVFERFIPKDFQSWRQATFYLLREIIGMQYSVQSSPRSSYSLAQDPHLPHSSTCPSNIGLLSEVKPQVVTHRRGPLVSTATESSVCVNNGLNYRYFDSAVNLFVESFVPTPKVLEICTYRLPERSKGLQQYLYRPASLPNGPAPNVVIANQSETQTHMSTEETRDLATLPLGHHIQLHNILVQLAAPSLDFRKEETTIFMLQCLYQSGPRGKTPLRAGHAVVNDKSFTSCLLENVATAWHRVKENWECAQALIVFVAVTTRVLSLASSEKVIKQRCLKLLSTLRTGAFAWVGLLRDKSHAASTQDDRAFFRSKSVDIALICVSCFDVESRHLSSILKSDSDASIFVQCSILIQEGKRAYDLASELTLSCLNLRFRRLLYRSSHILSATHSGISDAVKKSWSAYRPGGGWQMVCDATHWLVTETASDSQGVRFQVHYNLLSGELLVNGLSLSRPPQEYEAHPMWPTLFGHVAVEVMPTSAAGMQFSAKRQHEGYDICFGLNRTSSGDLDLLVQASNSTIEYETIPARLLQGMFPTHFIHGFVHWYNCIDKTLEFRPLAAPWDSGGMTCTLSKSSEGWTLIRKGCAVLGVNSTTSTAIANLLSPLAEGSDIHVLLQRSDGSSLEVEIPALQLGFFLNLGESNLRSREFRGMLVDSDQSLGTLIGLINKLILKRGNQRLVLVPEGEVSWKPDNGHVRVMVEKSSITKVHALHVDGELGRLIDNGDLQGKLFLSYLHALTSYCLPDTLTKRTGVEQSLSTLNSAGVRSFDQLSLANISILARIARLTPRRQYYPQNERVMQTVSWEPGLSYLSQHDGFYKAVASIFEQARQSSLFYLDSDNAQLDIHGHIDTDQHLMERDRIRSSTFRIAGFGAEEHTAAYDVTYCSRDRNQASPRGTNAYVLSSMLYHERTTLHTDAPARGEFWSLISNTPTVLGPDQKLHVSQLKYSAGAANSGLNLSQWLVLHKALSTQSAVANKFSVMIWLSAMAAHEQADMRYLQVLALFFTTDKLKQIELPSIQLCHPPRGYRATSELLSDIVRSNLVPLDSSPEAKMRADPQETWRSFKNRQDSQFRINLNNTVHTLVSHLVQQWPTATPIPLHHVDGNICDYVQLKDLEVAVTECFKEWFSNLRLFEYLKRVESALSYLECNPLTLYQHEPATLTPPSRPRAFVSVNDLFAGPAPTLPKLPNPIDQIPPPRLVGLVSALKHTAPRSRYEYSYIEELCASMQSLQGQGSARYPDLRDKSSIQYLRQHLDDCKTSVDDLYHLLASNAGIAHNGTLELGYGPRRSPILFLQQLRDRAWKSLNLDWRKCISRYGLALTTLQRAERLVRAASSPSDDDLMKEMKNVGHRNWDPIEHPEWLLLEVESSIMIRDVQEQIASEMINPSSRCNAVMQLNMGEGKSSVIVPMVAAELANGSQLARVIVAKPQSKQMAQMLISKLGGLLNRRVYYMPFSRALNIGSTRAAAIIDKIMRECEDSGGVLLVQPEHLLSFQLLGIECYCSRSTVKQAIGMSLIRIQDFFDNNSRDIVDESDENFSPKFELVYTMGSQRPIEMSPTRWICMQQVLDLVRSLAADVADQLPQSIDVGPQNDGRFPKVRLLKADAGKLLVERVARHICNKGLDGFPIARQQQHVREAVFNYITQFNLSEEEINAAEKPGNEPLWTESTKSLLLLLRGILAGGVLAFVLGQKRWRVNFGFAKVRTPPTKLAVPYRAKDNPTPRSEFSHPDVVIALTCLSYYYGGLENDDLFIALGHLVDSDQAIIEYDAWIKDAPHMPASFRQLDGINQKDRPQCINDVFPYLKYGKSVIDYFLGHIVFPKQVKEFPYKLSASGWDIGKTKAHYITGFSGTNDSRKLLPIDVKHIDLPSQRHTNALVLEYLLQPENSVVLLCAQSDSSMTDSERIIDTVVKLERPTRVILDVGAQILELDNQEVAQTWLQMVTDTKTQAAVFVNDNDELSVIDRQGRLELLQTSSYATQLDSCLIFLDEAHTRGIDLKLPDDYRAAVTLGANLSKDRLVQACMRMRKLGKGQSVVFCISPEIQSKIQECTGISTDVDIGVKDVLHWAIWETFAETRRSIPLWAVQGDRFLRQEELWKSVQAKGVTSMSNAHAEQFLEDEAQSINARYCPRPAEAISVANMLHSESLRIEEIKERCDEFGDLNFNSSTLEEEQERELSPEIERERQVQRPPPAQPVSHSLHQDIKKFISTGHLMPTSPAYMRAFDALRDTREAQSFEASQLSNGHLFVTTDFATAVEASDNGYFSDSFQRPVQWILSSHAKGSNVVDVLLILSPYEAEELMPGFQSAKSSEVALHLYKPRCHSVHRAFDRLDFFTIPHAQMKLEVPRALLVELNLFAGQLYFSEYEDYQETCKFLGLADDVPKEGQVVATDGYILRDSNAKSKFDKSPVRFLQGLTSTIRRNGQDISKTHVGSMLDGKLLQRSDIEA